MQGPPGRLLRLHLEGNQPVGGAVTKPVPAPVEVRAEVGAQEPERPQLAPLADVLLLMAEQDRPVGTSRPDRNHRADRDGIHPRWHGATDPQPVVTPTLDAHARAPSVQARRQRPAELPGAGVAGAEKLQQVDVLLARPLVVLHPVEQLLQP
jgi:hypothetical protein